MNESIYELRVSRAASGAYPTISDALAATDQLYPDAEQAVTIHIDPGEYRERVEIHRPHVTLAGETADSVRIVGSLGAKMPSEDGSGVDGTLGTFRTYTVLVDADDVRLENLTIVNDAGGWSRGGTGDCPVRRRRPFGGRRLLYYGTPGYAVFGPVAPARSKTGRVYGAQAVCAAPGGPSVFPTLPD